MINSKLKQLMHDTESLRHRLINHPLYNAIDTLNSLQLFMEYHIFAVWDFMSLLKALQNKFSCTHIPWIPCNHPKMTRLINEIVLSEESDQIAGSTYSHLEFYLLAMQDLGCDTLLISQFIEKVRACKDYHQAVETLAIPEAARLFMDNTFSIIESNDVVAIAAAFTIGREGLIPEMFIEIIKRIKNVKHLNLEKLILYLERHIELDGGDHGPSAMQMLTELCQEDESLWNTASYAALRSLKARIDLWDSILVKINNKSVVIIPLAHAIED
jgi:hypothetical protein